MVGQSESGSPGGGRLKRRWFDIVRADLRGGGGTIGGGSMQSSGTEVNAILY